MKIKKKKITSALVQLKKMDLALVDAHPKVSFHYDAIKFDEGII